MPRVLKKPNETSSSSTTPTPSKTQTQTGNTIKSTITPTTNKESTTSPDDQATIIEQQQQIIDKLVQRVNILEEKLSQRKGRIRVS